MIRIYYHKWLKLLHSLAMRMILMNESVDNAEAPEKFSFIVCKLTVVVKLPPLY